MRSSIRIVSLLLAIAIQGFAGRPAFADLSAQRAFILIRSVPPGEDLEKAEEFLGAHAGERDVKGSAGIKVRRWGGSEDEWIIDLLHDGSRVMASRITWRTESKRDQQTIFSQLTSAGKKYFGRNGKFNGLTEAVWTDMGGTLLVMAKQEAELAQGVTLLTGVRDSEVDSGKYGF
jgi:hypothetical protein